MPNRPSYQRDNEHPDSGRGGYRSGCDWEDDAELLETRYDEDELEESE